MNPLKRFNLFLIFKLIAIFVVISVVPILNYTDTFKFYGYFSMNSKRVYFLKNHYELKQFFK
jgi:hypothetical protein